MVIDSLINEIYDLLVADQDIIDNIGVANVHKWLDLQDYKNISVRPFVNLMPLPSELVAQFPSGGDKEYQDIRIFIEVIANYDPIPANSLAAITLANYVYAVLVANSKKITISTGRAILQHPLPVIYTTEHENHLRIVSFETTYNYKQ